MNIRQKNKMNMINALPTSLSDPEKFGPGVWLSLHAMALSARNEESIHYFINYVEIILKSLACNNCRKHALRFFEKDHPKNYIHYKDSKGQKTGMFLWTFQLHNACNSFLEKPIMSWDKALKLYEDLRDGKLTCDDCTPKF